MRIYLMTDLEGVAGVVNVADWCVPEGRYYDTAKTLLTLEVNAAIQGFMAAGATAVDVVDGHGAGAIDPLRLDQRAEYIRSTVGPYPFQLSRTHACIAWIGQHAMAGTPMAHIAHTGSFDVLSFQINGQPIGEFGQMALIAGELGVTPIFASGDQALADEAAALVLGVETSVVKWGLTPGSGEACDTEAYAERNLSARHLHPEVARERICRGAELALRAYQEDSSRFTLRKRTPPYCKEVIYRRAADGTVPPTTIARHPDSVIALLNDPGSSENR